jgi:hypothetical protein
MTLLSFFLLLGLTAPQDQLSSTQSSGDWRATPVFTVEQFNAARARRQLQAPQDQPSSTQSSGDWLAAPVFTVEQFNAARARRLLQRQVQRMRDPRTADSSTCYTIKSYIFEREDGNAPVLVATTTCTPASTLQWRQVDRPPQPRLVPAR